MITLVTTGWCSSQASATRATVEPRASAIVRIAATQAQARSLSTGGKSKEARLAPSGLGAPGPYLPDKSPPASGDQTIRPSFSSCISGTSSRSRSRPAML